MSDDEYNKKLESLQQYIPFLDNMITQLKDPSKKNRENQLTKMESLHAMITDKKRKLKLETLNKCEDVISKLYLKVNHKPLNLNKNIDSPLSTPASPSPTRDIVNSAPLTIPMERCDDAESYTSRFDTVRKSHLPKIDIYSSAAESLKPKLYTNSKSPDTSKPPISLEDLKTLEDDVHEKITNAASLRELDNLRNKIAHQIIIEDIKILSPSTHNRPINRKTHSFEDKFTFNTTTVPKYPVSPTKEYHNKPNEVKEQLQKPNTLNFSPIQLTLKPKSTILNEPASIFENINQIIEDQKKKNKHSGSKHSSHEREKSRDGEGSRDKESSSREKESSSREKESSSREKESSSREKESSNREKESSNREKESSNREKESSNREKDSSNREKESSNREKESSNRERQSSNREKESSNREKESSNREKESSNREKESSNRERESSNRERESSNREKESSSREKESSSREKESSSRDKEAKAKSESKDKHVHGHKDTHNDGKKSHDKKDKESKSKHHSNKKDSSETNTKEEKLIENKSSKYHDRANLNKDKKNKDSKHIKESDNKQCELVSIKRNDTELNANKFNKEPSIVEEIVTFGYKRLADKYNPKPKKPTVEVEVDKTVSEKIEASMRIAPPSIPLIGPVPAPTPPSASLLACSQVEPELPQVLQNILNPTATQIINNVVIQLKNSEAEQMKRQSLVPTQPIRSTPPLHHNIPRLMSPPDSFVSDYSRDYGNHSLMQRPHFENQQLESTSSQFVPPINTSNFISSLFRPTTPTPMFNHLDRFSQSQHNFNQTSMEGMHSLDYYPPNAPIPTNQYSGGPPLLSPEIPHFTEHKTNSFLLPSRDMFSHQDDFRWRIEENRQNWDRINFENRRPMTYREYRELKESRDPRLAKSDLRDTRENRDNRSENRDPRDNKDPRDNREPIRDPRLQRDVNVTSRNVREQICIKDPRLNRSVDRHISKDEADRGTQRDESRGNPSFDRSKSRDADFNRRPARETGRSRDRERSNHLDGRYESKFDRLYSRTNRERSRSRSRTRTDSNDTFTSPLDSLYTGKEEHKTGKGYGVQHFRIPKKKKEDEDDASRKISDNADTAEEADSEDKNIPENDDGCQVDKAQDLENKSFTETECIKNIPEGIAKQTVSNKKNQKKKRKRKQEEVEATDKQVTEVIKEQINDQSETDNCQEEFESNLLQHNISEMSNENSLIHKEEVEDKDNKHDYSTLQANDQAADEKARENKIDHKPDIVTETPTPQKPGVDPETSKPPAEQTILAQFFTNLLSSQNKKEKKTALYSLINTFSDSFSPKELSKITKIIKADDGDHSEEECSDEESKSNKQESVTDLSNVNPPTETCEKQEESTCLTEIDVQTETTKTTKKANIRKRSRRISSSSPLKEDKSENKEKVDDNKQEIDNVDIVQEDPVLVSVGERIKSRKRLSTTPPKPKKKNRTELDMLHEDIQDMFIRDGVLTANGKRMCRILKGDPTALTASTPVPPVPEGSPKIRKKPGPKPKSKQHHVSNINSLKNVRIVISKIPESAMEERRTTRRMARNMQCEESEEESLTRDNVEKEEKMLKDDTDVESSDTEKDRASQASDTSHKQRIVKRKRGKKWASGIIKKQKKKDKPATVDFSTEETKEMGEDTFLPEKDYFIDFKEKQHSCKLCPFKGRFITTHYKHVHPESEVITSRLSPACAKEAIKDAEENLAKYESYLQKTKASAKIHFICRICLFETTVASTHFYDHLSSHTGEYRHICPCCNFSSCSGKTLIVHMKHNHENNDTPVVRKTYNQSIQFGYLCGECNYVQLNENKVIEHINIYHLQETTVHKINLSLVFDPNMGKIEKPQPTENSADSNNSKEIVNEEINVSSDHNEQLLKTVENIETATETTATETTATEITATEIMATETTSPKRKKRGPKPGPRSRKKIIEIEKPISDDTAKSTIKNSVSDKNSDNFNSSEIRNDDLSVPSLRRRKSLASLSSNEDISPVRTKRAAKEKAQEKLRHLAEINDSPIRKKSTEDSKTTNNETRESVKEPDIENVLTEDKSQNKTEVGKKNSEIEEKDVKQEVDMNVFTCKTDIQAENKKIELERLQKMEELNKSVGNRTSLNFVDKLCNRLSQNAVVKQEPHEDFVDDHNRKSNSASPLTMPVLEKNLPLTESPSVQLPIPPQSTLKKSILETECSELPPTTNFDVVQKNDKNIVNMIEKLKGKLASSNNSYNLDVLTVDDEYDSEGPPPLTHVNEIENVKPLDSSAKTLLVGGLIKVFKTTESITFCCLVPPCAYSTNKQTSFQRHCKLAHPPQSIGRSTTLCESCGLEVKSTVDTNLLVNLFKHMVNEHNEFLIDKSEKNISNSENNSQDSNESTKTDTSTKTTNSIIRIRKLSGDALSVTRKDWEEEIDRYENTKSKSGNCEIQPETEKEPPICQESDQIVEEPTTNVEEPTTNLAELEISDENPFPFKIADVVSLAEPEQQIPPLAPIAKQSLSIQPSQQLIVKEAKLTETELKKLRKTPKAMSKFLSAVGDLYKCPHYYCLFTTNFRDFLERHLKAHKTEQDVMIPCVYCDMKTPWEHVPMHIDIRHAHCRFACSYCLYRAIAKEYVFLHQDKEHPTKDYMAVALPLSKSNKKFAVADHKLDPKALCEPFRCTHYCNADFLFLNEFRRHLVMVHGNHNFVMCGHPNCTSRIVVDKIPQHWAAEHEISLYQCGYCKTNNNDLKTMYYHFAKCHPGQVVDIIVRLLTPLQDKITYGYSDEAFKRLRKIATIPNVAESKFDDNLNNSSPVPTIPALPAARKDITYYPKQSVLIPVVSASGKTFSLSTTTTPTPKTTNLLLLPSTAATKNFENLVKANPTKIITSVTSPTKIVKVAPSTISLLPTTTVVTVTTPISMSSVNIPINTVCSVLSSTSQVSTLVTNSPSSATSTAFEKITMTEITETNELIPPSKDLNIPPVEQVIIGEEPNHIVSNEHTTESEIDPLDLSDLNENNSHMFSSDDESDNSKTDKHKKKIGLLGYQLFRCAFCSFSCTNSNDMKKHFAGTLTCKSSDNLTKPFVCVHCKKHFRNAHVLVEHIQCHGILRFICSLCENKFPTTPQARNHMKQRHSVNQTTLTPLNALKSNIDTDEYIVKPKLVLGLQTPKQATSSEPLSSPVASENVFMPEDIEKVPYRSIFSYDIKCGICSYSSKVRTNIVRHLQFHSQEKAVPDSAPVNPVPCLEKNEKMFDKMINLASSSHTGRMGGTKDGKDKELEHLPEFIPSHTRYVCCAHGCQYICPEEANLRHHLIALHDGETSFTCVHCKANITPTDADNLIKHFRLHGLQLYKCHYCSFLHHLKHKVEKHITDSHLDLAVKVITIRHLESEPLQEPSTSGTQNISQTKSFKPWRCCMCKKSSDSQEGIQNHVLEKHEIDAQYKCALCSYKTNDKDTFIDHFKDVHESKEIDIIYIYRKVEEVLKDSKDGEAFDTTPLWQRDRPRIRHIRGILFEEESSPVPTKTQKKSSKTSGTPNSTKSSQSESSTPKSNNLDLAIEAVAKGTADILQVKTPNTLSEEALKAIDIDKEDDDIIVIDDDDDISQTSPKDNAIEPKTYKRKNSVEIAGIVKIPKLDKTNLSNGDFEKYDLSEQNLKAKFGDFGLPLSKQLMCPKCKKFKSKRISDFIFHIFKEMKVYRFKCGVCADESITYRYMFGHVKDHKSSKNVGEDIIALPSNPQLEVWLQMLIQNQSSTIIKSLSLIQETTDAKEKKSQCSHCQKWYRNEGERNEHNITHWTALPYKCDTCDFAAFTVFEIEKHFEATHSNFSMNILDNGPLVGKELETADTIHMEEVKNEVGPTLVAPNNTSKDDDTNKELKITAIISSYNQHIPEIHISDDQQTDSINDPLQSDILNNLDKLDEIVEQGNKIVETEKINEADKDDLVIVTRTDTNVPSDGDVYCCEYCPYMSNSEMSMISHISGIHEHMHVKFKVLNPVACELRTSDYVGCVLCPEIGSEIKIRQHYLEMHQGHTFMTYRFTCSYCNKRFMKTTGLKYHSSRTHPGLPLKFESVNKDGDVVSLINTPVLKGNTKCYKCPFCSYERNFPSQQFGNVRTHLRNHFKAYSCVECINSKFRNRIDAINHCTKEHPGRPECVSFDPEVDNAYHRAVKDVQENSLIIVKATASTNTARKSTASPQKKLEEEYSYYGQPVENIDLSKIMTSVEINGMHLDMSADKLGKIFDLEPQLYVEDCSLTMDLSGSFDS